MPTIVDKAAMNNNGSKPVEGRSCFPLNQRIAGGYRFGLYQPCFVEDTVPDDTLPLKSSHNLRSMNLKAPLLGDVTLHKEFFDVPFSVMLPLNYEKLFVQPNIGQDVDAAEVGVTVVGLIQRIRTFLGSSGDWLGSAWSYFMSVADEDNLGAVYGSFFRWLSTFKSVFSNGSILTILGEDISANIKSSTFNDVDGVSQTWYNVDRLIDNIYAILRKDLISLCANISTDYITFTIDGEDFVVNPSLTFDGNNKYLTFRQFLERVDDASEVILLYNDGSLSSDTTLSSTFISTAYAALLNLDPDYNYSKPLSLARPLAYQLACAEFFTNSHVDYIYSAELYRQNIDNLLHQVLRLSRDVFSWNGVDYLYDTLSAHNLKRGLGFRFNDFDEEQIEFEYNMYTMGHVFDLYRLIFGFNRSLRYVDYFTGSRTRPLAVGNTNVQVHSGYVNIVETIQTRWYTKFLNQVNRAGRKLSEYSRALFPGLTMSRDMHDPMWLAHLKDTVIAEETANTGAAQQTQSNSISSNLLSNGERYAFEYRPERYGICIGILYFDIARYYPHVIERNNFNVDRNDYFNPFLQFNGDQYVYADELNSGFYHEYDGEEQVFGYQGRDMQYKQKVDRCFGPFNVPGELPGWLFIAPDDAAHLGLININQSPSFIRCYPSEFDQFFTALTGYSPATYFHFLVINTNNMNASRPMVANPQLD